MDYTPFEHALVATRSCCDAIFPVPKPNRAHPRPALVSFAGPVARGTSPDVNVYRKHEVAQAGVGDQTRALGRHLLSPL